jgi:hypothetical protein
MYSELPAKGLGTSVTLLARCSYSRQPDSGKPKKASLDDMDKTESRQTTAMGSELEGEMSQGTHNKNCYWINRVLVDCRATTSDV